MNLRQHTIALILAAGLSASAFAATTAPAADASEGRSHGGEPCRCDGIDG